MNPITKTILSGATATGVGSWVKLYPKNSNYQVSYQAVVTGTGTVSATVDIEVSLDGTNALDTPMDTITCSAATTTSSDGFTSDAPWIYVRANVTAILGTDAAVTVTAFGDMAEI